MLRDIDSADRAFLLRAVAATLPAGCFMGAAVGYYLHETRHFSGVVILAGAAAGLVVGAGAGVLAYWSAGRTSRGLVHLLTASGNLPPAPSFSYQESLVARGRCREAVESFEAHLALHPEDHEARLAMGQILARDGGRRDEAVRVFLAVRQGTTDPRLDFRASQALIDLYAAAEDRGRHLTELARLADRYRNTPAGQSAKRALAAFKARPGR